MRKSIHTHSYVLKPSLKGGKLLCHMVSCSPLQVASRKKSVSNQFSVHIFLSAPKKQVQLDTKKRTTSERVMRGIDRVPLWAMTAGGGERSGRERRGQPAMRGQTKREMTVESKKESRKITSLQSRHRHKYVDKRRLIIHTWLLRTKQGVGIHYYSGRLCCHCVSLEGAAAVQLPAACPETRAGADDPEIRSQNLD